MSPVTNSQNRILLADDDPVIRHLLTSVIKSYGYSVVPVSDGREAFRILKSDADFKAAIFDMTMPYLQGMDLIHYMRTEKRLKRIPIMVITSEQDIKIMADCFAAGATTFLPKPLVMEQLKKMLRMMLGTDSSSAPTD